MKNIFTKHPNGIGESYLQHLIKGIIFSFKLVPIAVKVFIHAIFPFLFENSASNKIAELNRLLQARKVKTSSDDS